MLCYVKIAKKYFTFFFVIVNESPVPFCTMLTKQLLLEIQWISCLVLLLVWNCKRFSCVICCLMLLLVWNYKRCSCGISCLVLLLVWNCKRCSCGISCLVLLLVWNYKHCSCGISCLMSLFVWSCKHFSRVSWGTCVLCRLCSCWWQSQRRVQLAAVSGKPWSVLSSRHTCLGRSLYLAACS